MLTPKEGQLDSICRGFTTSILSVSFQMLHSQEWHHLNLTPSILMKKLNYPKVKIISPKMLPKENSLFVLLKILLDSNIIASKAKREGIVAGLAKEDRDKWTSSPFRHSSGFGFWGQLESQSLPTLANSPPPASDFLLCIPVSFIYWNLKCLSLLRLP